MAANIVRATLLADAQRFKAGFKDGEQAVSSFEQNVKSKFNAVRGFMAGMAVVAVKQLIDIGVAMNNLNIEAESVARKVDVVFGDMADAAREWAESQKEAFGVGQVEMENMVAEIQDVLIPMGFARDAAFELSKELLLTANATAEMSGGTVTASRAADIFMKAVTGEREGLKALGIVILEADVQARLLAKGQDKLTGEALKQARALATLELSTEASTDALKAYETRTGTALAEQKEMASQTQDLTYNLAQLFKPALEEASGATNDLITILGFLVDELTNAGDAGGEAKGWLEEFGEAAKGNFLKVAGFPVWVTGEILEFAAGLIEGDEAAEDAARAFSTMGGELNQIPAVARAATGAIDDQADAQGDLAEKTKKSTDAILTQMEVLRASVDPVFAAMGAVENLTTAQATLEELQGDSAATAAELAEAELNVALALLEAQGAMDSLDTGTLNRAIDSLATVLGKSKDEVILLLQQLGILDGSSVTTYIDVVQRVKAGTGIPKFHEGGVVEGDYRGQEVAIIAKVGETVLPTHKSGIKRPPVSSNGHANGQPTVVNITVNALDPASASKAVVQALQTYIRNNGGRLPW